MKGLIKKDLYNLSSYKMSLLIALIFCSCFVLMDNVVFGPVVFGVILGMIALSTFNYDETSKSEKYILSLPVTKKEIVISKYILAIISSILGTLLGMIISIVLVKGYNMIQTSEVITLDMDILFSTTIGSIFGIALIQAIQIPSMYKWGAERGRIQMFVILIAIAVLGTLLFGALKEIDFTFLRNMFNQYGLIIIILLTIIIYFISYKISLKIYKNKDY